MYVHAADLADVVVGLRGPPYAQAFNTQSLLDDCLVGLGAEGKCLATGNMSLKAGFDISKDSSNPHLVFSASCLYFEI